MEILLILILYAYWFALSGKKTRGDWERIGRSFRVGVSAVLHIERSPEVCVSFERILLYIVRSHPYVFSGFNVRVKIRRLIQASVRLPLIAPS